MLNYIVLKDRKKSDNDLENVFRHLLYPGNNGMSRCFNFGNDLIGVDVSAGIHVRYHILRYPQIQFRNDPRELNGLRISFLNPHCLPITLNDPSNLLIDIANKIAEMICTEDAEIFIKTEHDRKWYNYIRGGNNTEC